MIAKKSDDAVSPVIGVMLMLVVTVVIATAVTIFATGVVGETEPAPVAVLDVEIFSNVFALDNGLSSPDFWITHLSGDAVDTKDIEIRLSWTHDGCSHYSTYSAEGCYDKYPITTNRWNIEEPGIKTSYLGVGMNRKQPMYVKMVGGEGGFGLDHYFGDVVLTPGLKLTASADCINYGSYSASYTKSPFMDIIFDNGEIHTDDGDGIMEHLKAGTAVDVMIVHLPSNKAIYDNTVVVQ